MDDEYSTLEQQLQMGSAAQQHMPRLWEPHSDEQQDRYHDFGLNIHLRHALQDQQEEQLSVSNAQDRYEYIGFAIASTQPLNSMSSQRLRSASNLWSQSESAFSVHSPWYNEPQSDRVASAPQHLYDTQMARVSWQAGFCEGLRAAEMRSRPTTCFPSSLEGVHCPDGNLIYPIQEIVNGDLWEAASERSDYHHQQQHAESAIESDGVAETPKRRKRKQNDNRLKKRSEFFRRKKEEKQAAKAARPLTESPLQIHRNIVRCADECSLNSPVASSRGSWAENLSDTAHVHTYSDRGTLFFSRSSTPSGLGAHRILSTPSNRTNSLPVYQVESAKNAVDLEKLKRSPLDAQSTGRRRSSCEELKNWGEFLNMRPPRQGHLPQRITYPTAPTSNNNIRHSSSWANEWSMARDSLDQALTKNRNSQDNIPRFSESDAREPNLDSLMDDINMPERTAPQQLLKELERMEGLQLDLKLDESQSRLREKSLTWPTCSRA